MLTTPLVQPWLRVAYCLVFCWHLNLARVVTLNSQICQLKWCDDWYLMIGDSLGWVDCVHKFNWFVWQCLWIYLVLQGILPVDSTAGLNWLSSPTVTEWTEHCQPNDPSAWSMVDWGRQHCRLSGLSRGGTSTKFEWRLLLMNPYNYMK